MPLDLEGPLPIRSAMILLGMAATILLAISVAWALAIDRLRRGLPLVPAREGGPIPWGGREVVVSFIVWQVATLAASQLLHSRRGAGGELDLVDAISAVGLINLGLVVALPLLLALMSGATAADLGIRRGTIAGDVGIGIAAGLFSVPLVYAVQFAAILVWKPTAHPLQEMLLADRSPWVLALAFSTAVLLAPAAEELLFRGVLQGWLERRLHLRREAGDTPATPIIEAPAAIAPPDPGPGPEEARGGPWETPGAWPIAGEGTGPGGEPAGGDRVADRLAIVLPAAVFAAVHLGQWPAPLPLFVLAMGLGLLYRRTRGIVAPIAMHATFNGLSTVAMIVIVLVVPRAGPAALPVDPAPGATAPEVAEPDGEAGPGGLASDRNVESV